MYTYIIVDDEPLIRRGFKKKIESMNDVLTCVGEASNGEKAIELMNTLHPDIVITDMKMPVIDGTKLLPILSDQFPEAHIIVISGYKDFDYTQQAIRAQAVDYLLKPVKKEDFIHTLQNTIHKIESSSSLLQELSERKLIHEHQCYLHDLQTLANTILGYRSLNIEISSKKLTFVTQNYQIQLITICSDSILRVEEIQQLLLQNAYGDLALYIPHPNVETLGFLLLFLPASPSLSPKKICFQIIQTVDTAFSSKNTKLRYGISLLHRNLEELHLAFMETVNALDYLPLSYTEHYNFYPEHPTLHKIEWTTENELLFRIEAGMLQQTQSLTNELFDYLATLDRYTLADVKLYCQSLATKVKLLAAKYIKEFGLTSIHTSSKLLLNSMFSIDELRQYYLQLFSNICTSLAQDAIYSSSDLVENIKTYVTQNYEKNLTVEFIASLFNINRNYCSLIFNKKTSCSLTSFINQTRINHSKELLLHTDMKIHQISQSVGYENEKYFFRIFKKTEGVTPDSYRKQSCRT